MVFSTKSCQEAYAIGFADGYDNRRRETLGFGDLDETKEYRKGWEAGAEKRDKRIRQEDRDRITRSDGKPLTVSVSFDCRLQILFDTRNAAESSAICEVLVKLLAARGEEST